MTLPHVVVAGLGPAGPDLVTAGTRDRLASTPTSCLFLRTRVHPAAVLLDAAVRSFDDVYESAASFDDVYRGIVDELIGAATRLDEIVYVVPGSPMVAEHTVELLVSRAEAGEIALTIEPALSFLDLTWARLRVDPMTANVTVIDGHRFVHDPWHAGGAALIAQCHSSAVLADIKLALDTDLLSEMPRVTVLHHLGLDDERIVEAAWDDLDRLADVAALVPDHLTSLYVPSLPSTAGAAVMRLEEQMRALRERCPWDREQSHESLARYVLEEAAELVEAIGQLDGSSGSDESVRHLRDELGDVLFQVVFHARLASESGWFSLADVADALHAKMERRHPHVFAGLEVADADEVARNWAAIKAAEAAESGTTFTAAEPGRM